VQKIGIVQQKYFSRPAEIAGRLERFEKRLSRCDGKNLTALVVSARRACRVGTDAAAALSALAQLRRVPAVRGLARPQTHLRCFSFWNSHKLLSFFQF
jgi:hypothetical protein